MNLNIRPEITFVILLLLGLSFNACKTKKSLSSDGFQNEFLGIKGLPCSEIKNPDAIDSQVGTIACSNITFTYDYGKFSYPGPLTPEEEFRRSFDTYHHTKFFENRMIDPKVYKIFLDSVEVIDVRKKQESDILLFACDPCNTTAEITFKGDTYLYPLTLSEKQLNMEGFTAMFEEKGEFIYKYYKEGNSLPGLYITPKKNRFKKKNTLSLQVSNTLLTEKEVDRILRSVYLLE